MDTASEGHLQHYWPMQELTSQFSKDTVVGDQILLQEECLKPIFYFCLIDEFRRIVTQF
jgi:hypothetical protein